jgi:hypothetical protein
MRTYTPYSKPLLKTTLFDGNTNYLETTQGITSHNHAQGVVSCWIKRQMNDKAILCEANQQESLVLRVGIHELFHYVYVDIRAGSHRFFFRTARNVLMPDNSWHHLLVSWNTNLPRGQKSASIYIDDKPCALEEKLDESAAFIAATSAKNWRIGTSFPATTVKMKASIAQLYVKLGMFYNIDETAIRRQWISPYRKPVRFKAYDTPQLLLFEHNGTENKGSSPAFISFGLLTTQSANI